MEDCLVTWATDAVVQLLSRRDANMLGHVVETEAVAGRPWAALKH